MKKLFLFLFVGVFLFNFVSAFNWDKTQFYFNFNNNNSKINNTNYLSPIYTYMCSFSNGSDRLIDFYGSFSYIGDVSNAKSTKIENTKNIKLQPNTTLSFWYEISSSDAYYREIINKYYSGSGWRLYTNRDNTADRQLIFDFGGNYLYSNFVYNGTWTMITIVYNESGISLWSNSVLKDFLTTSSTPDTSYLNIELSKNKSSDKFPFTGKLDELAFFDRALNDSEIEYLYNNGSGISFFEVNLLSPEDNYQTLNKTINFSCSSNTYSSFNLKNISLLIEENGQFVIKNTTTFSLNNTYEIATFLNHLNLGDYNWTCSACDEDGTCVNSQTIKKLSITNVVFNSQTYNSTIYETSSETYSINITYDSSKWLSITGNLIYDGTSYIGTKSGTGDNLIFYKTLDIPPVNSTINKTFYWEIKLTNSSGNYYYNSTFNNQTIKPLNTINITSASCPSGTFEAVNYTFQDAGNFSDLNVSIDYNFKYGISNMTSKEIYGTFNNIHSFRICVNESNQNYKLGHGEIEYSTNGYILRKYYMFEGFKLDNITDSYILYDLINGDSTSFIFEIKDSSLNAYPNKYISLMRWYPEINEYKIVEMGKTDTDGKTVMKVKTEDVDYRVGVYELNGSLIHLAGSKRIACLVDPCTYTLTISVGEEDWSEFYDIESNLSFDSANNRFLFIWNDPSQNTVSMRLYVIKETGFQDLIICNTTGTGYTGVLSCEIGNYTGIIRAMAFRTASPEDIITSLYHEVRDGWNNSIGLFISFSLAMVSALIGFFSPIGAIIMVLISLIPSVILGSITFPIFMAIGTLGGIIIHMIKRSRY